MKIWSETSDYSFIRQETSASHGMSSETSVVPDSLAELMRDAILLEGDPYPIAPDQLEMVIEARSK